jgi:hypothetical protein
LGRGTVAKVDVYVNVIQQTLSPPKNGDKKLSKPKLIFLDEFNGWTIEAGTSEAKFLAARAIHDWALSPAPSHNK